MWQIFVVVVENIKFKNIKVCVICRVKSRFVVVYFVEIMEKKLRE